MGPRNEAVRATMHRMSADWEAVRNAFKKEQKRAAEYSTRKRADYQFAVGHDVLINRRRHY